MQPSVKTVKYALALVAFLLGTQLQAQGTLHTNFAWGSKAGNAAIIPFATVTVCLSTASGIPCSPKATIYTNQALSGPAAQNPFQADLNGYYSFWAVSGNVYKVCVSASGFNPYCYLWQANAGAPSARGNPGDLQENAGGGVLGASHLNDNGRSLSLSENVLPTSSQNISLKSNCSGTVGTDSGIRYADGPGGGSNSNDGCSLGSAKADLIHALCSLPGGNCSGATLIVGRGTVYYTDGTSVWASDANAGLCIMGGNDPNYSHPTSATTCDGKWVQATVSSVALNIVGVGQSNYGPNPMGPRAGLAGGSHGDNNHPIIWLSATGFPINFYNVASVYVGRPRVLGECSNNNRTGLCQAVYVRFINSTFNAWNASGYGPCTDVVGGFWISFEYDGCEGTAASNGQTADISAAYLLYGAGGAYSPGLIKFDWINVGEGGIKYYPGSNTGGWLDINHVTEEGNYTNHCPPAVWFTSNTNQSVLTANLENITIADCQSGDLIVENDGATGEWLTVSGVGANQLIQGPATVFGGMGTPNIPYSPIKQGQSGFFGRRVIGQVDEARRLFFPAAVRFTNLATQSGNSISGSGCTLSGSIAAPDGTSNAQKLHCPSNTGYAIIYSGSTTYSNGDWIVMGSWIETNSSGGPIALAAMLHYSGTTLKCYPYNSQYINGPIRGDGEWFWVWEACEYIGSGGSFNPFFVIQALAGTYLEFYGPVFNYIPASAGWSASEVLEYAEALSAYSSSCSVGTICGMTAALNANAGLIPGSYAVSALPSASSNAGLMAHVTDSTSISTEGQTCSGGSSNHALAFSNGSVWKCF